MKASPTVSVQNVYAYWDCVHLFDDSDFGTYSKLTLEGGRLKLQKDTGTGGVPQKNTFSNICVIHCTACSPDGGAGQPDSAFYFEGVTSGSNAVNTSAAYGSPMSYYATAISASTSNSITSLYNPDALTASTSSDSSWTTLTTQNTTEPICHGINDGD